MELSQKDIQLFQKKILGWYLLNKRDLPWRRTRDPYRILVSEVMLQQTQVSRVLPKYKEWLDVFADIETLANASVSTVLAHWMGLGYNRRALYLKKCAEAVVRLGKWPETEVELMKLPGIGKYTAHALLCFAFGKQVAVVDTNVRKVIVVELIKEFQQLDTPKKIEEIAGLLLPLGKAYEWNQALMDYASLALKKEKIPIPKQSRYIGSDRYYRAKILTLLLKEKRVKVLNMGKKIRSDFSQEHQQWLEKIVSSLEKDGLIIRRGVFISLFQ